MYSGVRRGKSEGGGRNVLGQYLNSLDLLTKPLNGNPSQYIVGDEEVPVIAFT